MKKFGVTLLVWLFWTSAALAVFPTQTPTPAPTTSCTGAGGYLLSSTATNYNEGASANANVSGAGAAAGNVNYTFVCNNVSGCDGDMPGNVGNSNANLWGIINQHFTAYSGAGGSMTMTYPADGTGFQTSVNFTGLGLTGVNGYPAYYLSTYGGGPWPSGQPPNVYPVPLQNLKQHVITRSYTLTVTNGANNDILLDEWLQPTNGAGNGFTPFQQLEVAIFLYYNFNYGPCCSGWVQQFVQPAVVNGVLQNVVWQEYDTSKTCTNTGSPQCGTVWFVPSLVHPSGSGVAYGDAGPVTITFDELPFLNEAKNRCAAGACGGSFSTYYYEGPQTGTEYGNDATPQFTFNLTKNDSSACMAKNFSNISIVNKWQGSATSASTCTVNTGTGTQQQVGDVEIGGMGQQASNAHPQTCPAGWTVGVAQFGISSADMQICYKVVAAPDIGASVSFATSGTDQLGCGVIDLRGVDTSTPIDVAGSGTTGTGTAIAPASISPAFSGDTLLWFATTYNMALITPNGFIDSFTNAYIPSAQHQTLFSGFVEPGISSGATGTNTSAQDSAFWAAVQVAVKPAVAGPTPTVTPTPAGLGIYNQALRQGSIW